MSDKTEKNEKATKLSELIKDVAGKAEKAAVPVIDKAKESMSQAMESAGPMIEEIREKAKVKAAQATEVAEEALEAAKPKVDGIKDRIVEATEKVTPVSRREVEPIIMIESRMGGQISVQEITNRVKAAVGQSAAQHFEIYVKPEENKAYYTSDVGDGSVDLW